MRRRRASTPRRRRRSSVRSPRSPEGEPWSRSRTVCPPRSAPIEWQSWSRVVWSRSRPTTSSSSRASATRASGRPGKPASRQRPENPLALCAFGWRLHGRPGERERPRLRFRLALLLFFRLGRRGRCRRLVGEDVLLGLTGEQTLELILVDRLALDEDHRDPVELFAVLLEHARCRVVRFFDDAPDLVVDLARDLLGVVGLVAHLAAEERHVVVPAEDSRAKLLAHAEAHDHLLGRVRYLLQAVGGAGGEPVEGALLGRTAAQGHGELVHQALLRRQVAILTRQRDRVPERLAAADDRDLVDL